jgi:hypothetical protein
MASKSIMKMASVMKSKMSKAENDRKRQRNNEGVGGRGLSKMAAICA